MEAEIKLKEALNYKSRGYGLSVTSQYDFMAGWEACLKHSPLVKSLIEALEFYANYNAHNPQVGFIAPGLDTAKKTIEKYRHETRTNQDTRTKGKRSSNRKTSSTGVGSNLGRVKKARKA